MERKRLFLVLAIVGVVIVAGAVAAKLWFLPESETRVDEDLPPAATQEEVTVLKTGTFRDGDRSHNVDGTIQLLRIGNEHYLRFIDYEQTQGPDVFVYLTESATPRSTGDVEDRGVRIRIDGGADGGESTKVGTFNQKLPAGLDLDRFNGIAIWCDDFNVLFGYASLASA